MSTENGTTPLTFATAERDVRAPPSNHHTLPFAYQTYLRGDVDEQAHWDDVCRAYRQYAVFGVKQFGVNHPHRLANLTASQQAVLPSHLQCGSADFDERFKQYKDAAIRNQFCLDCILRHAGQPHSQQVGAADTQLATEAQLSKVSSVLKSLVRDWSEAGRVERDAAYQPILRSVQTYLPIQTHRRVPKIAVPGAGVGRLACELAAAGYAVQGNEFSLYMLLASDFILNGGPRNQPLSISPWLLETRNVHAATDPLRAVPIPDVDPFAMVAPPQCRRLDGGGGGDDGVNPTVTATASRFESPAATALRPPMQGDATHQADFSMAAGDFGSIYSGENEASAWDCVVACFFLDASPSIIEHLQIVYHMLQPGGLLISFGPLHWHFSGPAMSLEDATVADYHHRYSYLDPKYMQSIDFCWDDIKRILVNIGFEMLETKTDIAAPYTVDPRSMLQSEYRCVHFVARKKGVPPSQSVAHTKEQPATETPDINRRETTAQF